MIILLVWIAVFSLISVGLLLTKSSSSSSLSNSDITSACQNGTINALTTNLTRIADACEAGKGEKNDGNPIAKIENVSIKGTNLYPGFVIPNGWHVSGDLTNSSEKGYTITMSDKPMIVYHVDSDAPSVTKIWIVTKVLPTEITPEKQSAYIASLYTDSHFSNVLTTSSTLTNGTLYTTTFHDGFSEFDKDSSKIVLHFFGATTLSSLTYNNEAKATDWEIIKNSLDWSTVK